ncbi:MAG: lytic murein transglycosylase [Rhodospirillaceae bacterium]|nr:lytic murein transglycosylase [Rhodospirillaceae bacterium]MBT4487147.1 lytic murein transglycosylase [Rhodospirillaceae bacterium]MBT5195682.1 lytic murein transglycosylase [Rhodospirillaceae bacterium]MBT5898429.1 lytic murein transglycosylase [Rhodospirillaceae bacterium]MBT6430275.1 lytic murein transglycosylase [Rhodospirillaceae bacterium]
MLARFAVFLAALVLVSPPAGAQDFKTWLAELRAEASSKGISDTILDAALGQISPIPRVIELDRRQPEFTMTYTQYRDRVVPASRIRKGRAKFLANRALLEEIGAKIGVQPRFIVALWGIETDFGRVTGGFKVIPALATLAHDGRRSAYFRKELLNALRILNEGHISPKAMVGSWAGAMGQCQFMPSSFLAHAVDYDGDGRRDIWTTRQDVFASAANYLAKSGWRADQTWGREVTLPAGFDAALADLKVQKPIGAWQALGVRNVAGGDLPGRQLAASIVLPEKGKMSPAYMVYNNYRTTLRWNRSTYFALAVGLLSDGIGAGG